MPEPVREHWPSCLTSNYGRQSAYSCSRGVLGSLHGPSKARAKNLTTRVLKRRTLLPYICFSARSRSQCIFVFSEFAASKACSRLTVCRARKISLSPALALFLTESLRHKRIVYGFRKISPSNNFYVGIWRHRLRRITVVFDWVADIG